MPHTHDVRHAHTIQQHTHEVVAGMRLVGDATAFQIVVNGVVKQRVDAKNLEGFDIIDYMKNNNQMLERDKYHRIQIVPNDFAHVRLTVSVQGFVQSRGDESA